MIKNLLPYLLLLIAAQESISQHFLMDFGGKYARYSHKDLKNLQAELVDLTAAEQTEIFSDFRQGPVFNAGLLFEKNPNFYEGFGLQLLISTGEIGFYDNIGFAGIQFNLTGFKLSHDIRWYFGEKKKLSIDFDVGLLLTHLNVEEYLSYPGFRDNEEYRFRSYGLSLDPTINYQVGGDKESIFLLLSAGYAISGIGSQLSLDWDSDFGLVLDNRSVRANWSGFHVGIAMGFKVKRKNYRKAGL